MDLFFCLVALFLISFFITFYFLIFFFIFYFNTFNYFYFTFFLFLSIFLPFLLNLVANKALVLQPHVRPVPLRRESWVQDIAPTEISQLHVISNGESSPRDLHLNAKTQLHSKRVSYSVGNSMPNNYQDRNTTPPIAERLPKIIIRSQTPQNTPQDVVLPSRKARSSPIHQNTGTSPFHQ